jgi:NAD(P)-dependent dehydrogenase (short-subunit alcohol dehydrogenase family)
VPGRRRFEGRIVVVTGAGGGIGRALARRFAQAGARVGVLDRDAEAVAALAGELAAAGVPALGQPCDVADREQCEAAIRAVERRFGGVDVLVNNAGITHRSPFLDTEVAVFRRVMDVNYFGALHCTKAALPTLLARRGLVIVVSSVAGLAPLLGRSGYCASKHALHGLFATLRCELRERGVHVMLVCPGFTATNIERNALDGHGLQAGHPQSRWGRLATPEAVAEAIYRGARGGRRLVVLSPAGRAARLLAAVAPGLYERAMSRAFRVELER